MSKAEQNMHSKYLRLEPYFHVLLWIFVLIYPYIKFIEREGGYPMSFLHELNSLFFKITISYFLYFWFFPKQNKKKYLPVAILVFIINALLYEYFDQQFFHGDFSDIWNHLIAKSFTYTSFGIGFFTLHSIKSSYKKQAEIDRLILEKQTAQLQALTAKVNPHFLFNTLNTVYAHALRKDDKTPELILKLSDGFRYVLHEGKKDYVTIDQEIGHLSDYINLQQERLSTKVHVDFETQIDDQKRPIAPLLLIGFIENSFKYTSIMKGHQHPIKIRVSLTRGLLRFSCKNPFEESKLQDQDLEWKESGTGIENTRERLDLLYPEKYRLEAQRKHNQFEVQLEIQL